MRPLTASFTKSSAAVNALSGEPAAPQSGALRCLVIAADGRPSSELLGFLQQRCQGETYAFHVVVPCPRRSVLVSDPALSSQSNSNEIRVHDRDYNLDVAEARLEGFLRLMSSLNQASSGRVESGNFFRKVQNLANLGGFDEILVLTSNRRRRTFGRRRDLTATLRRACEIPVTAVAVI